MELLFEQTFKLVMAVVLGGLIGWEREVHHKPAGLRTHILVCMGSALITLISIDYFTSDTARIVAGIITGIGFIGAGTTIAQGAKGVHGLTTAASLWVVAALGISVGIGWYLLSIISAILIISILFLGKVERRLESAK